MLDHPHLDIHEEDRCLTFFKVLLHQEVVPFNQGLEVLSCHCINIVQYDECQEERVDEVVDLFKKLQEYCSNVNYLFLPKEVDAKHCECYQYKRTGDCQHVNDNDDNDDAGNC